MAKKKIELPNIFKESTWEWMGKPKQFEKYIGYYAISWSKLDSFKKYREDWIKRMAGIKEDAGIFAEFGGHVGRLFETGCKDPEVCDEVRSSGIVGEDTFDVILQNQYPDGSLYEYPVAIVIDVGGTKILLYGFIDVLQRDKMLLDIKTGAISGKSEKISYYGGEDYKQTCLYAYGMEKAGEKVPPIVGVELYERKGNGTSKHPLRLTGEKVFIETPYSAEEVEKYIQSEIVPAVIEMSDYYKVFKNIFLEDKK